MLAPGRKQQRHALQALLTQGSPARSRKWFCCMIGCHCKLAHLIGTGSGGELPQHHPSGRVWLSSLAAMNSVLSKGLCHCASKRRRGQLWGGRAPGCRGRAPTGRGPPRTAAAPSRAAPPRPARSHDVGERMHDTHVFWFLGFYVFHSFCVHMRISVPGVDMQMTSCMDMRISHHPKQAASQAASQVHTDTGFCTTLLSGTGTSEPYTRADLFARN